MNYLGITINKHNLQLTVDHQTELNALNIGIRILSDHYVLYYIPDPEGKCNDTTTHLKGLLSRVRNDDIYDNYNDDFGLHPIKTKIKLIKKK